jgi:hypothetical protein
VKSSLLEKIIEEEIAKLMKEALLPNQAQIQKILQSLPVNSIAQFYGKAIFNLGGGKYIFPFPTENIVTGQDIAKEIEVQLQTKTKTSFEE